jgi:hypothetical protein
VQSGEVVTPAMTLPVFQCDECLVTEIIGREAFEYAYTFALDADDQVFDPAGLA